MNKVFHVYSFGENVLFRKDEDFISVNNKIAVACHVNVAGVLAMCIMSTHVHLVVEAADENSAMHIAAQVVKNYAIGYTVRYGRSPAEHFRFSCKEIEGIQNVKQEMLYVMRNPVHHSVRMSPISYRYSSAAYLFAKELVIQDYVRPFMDSCKRVDRLSSRHKAKVVGAYDVPGDWLVTPDGMIYPESFISNGKVASFWSSNVRMFLVDINRNVTDSNHEILKADTLDIRTNGIDDMEVCRIIDEFAAEQNVRSFHFLDQKQIMQVCNILRRRGCMNSQIRRCLWI